MYMDWNQILNGMLLAWWTAEFTPLQNLLNKYVRPYIPKWASYLSVALGCFKCLSFWYTLGLTQDFFAAVMAAVLAYSYEKFFNSLKQHF